MIKVKISNNRIVETEFIDERKVIAVVLRFFTQLDLFNSIDEVLSHEIEAYLSDMNLTKEEKESIKTKVFMSKDIIKKALKDYWISYKIEESEPATEPTQTLTSASKPQKKSALPKRKSRKTGK